MLKDGDSVQRKVFWSGVAEWKLPLKACVASPDLTIRSASFGCWLGAYALTGRSNSAELQERAPVVVKLQCVAGPPIPPCEVRSTVVEEISV